MELHKIYRGLSSEINFEISHRYFDRYYDANHFDVSFTRHRKIHTIRLDICFNFKEIVEKSREFDSTLKETGFDVLVKHTKVVAYSETGGIETSGWLMEHRCAEITFNRRSYFLFNGDWYLIRPKFVSELNRQCQEFLNKNLSRNFLGSWKREESENEFNSKPIGQTNMLVFDKVTPENIEAATFYTGQRMKSFSYLSRRGLITKCVTSDDSCKFPPEGWNETSEPIGHFWEAV